MNTLLIRLLGAMCALSLSASLFAQSETGKAALEGRVSDASGKLVQGVDVRVVETQTGLRRQVSTNSDGQFRLGALQVGIYQLEATAQGFGTSRVDNISLTVGETKSVNVTLQVASLNSQVTVTTDAQIVNQTDPSNSVTINTRAIEDLPIRGRNFTEFVQLTPNVMQEQDRFGIVVDGQRSINSNISVDGVDFNDSLQGGQRGGGPNESAYFFPQLAVREFQVVRSGATAEVGRTNAGFVNVVTKSGTNEYHGEGFYANRNGSLTSPDAFGNDSANNSQHQFGGAVGGPIQRDKLFFFGAVEKNLLTIPYTVKFNTPTGNVTVPRNILQQQGQYTQKNNPLVAFGRLDYQLNQANSVNVQYTYAAQYGLNFGGVSGITTAAATNNTILDRASQGVKAGVTSVLSPALLNEVRGQWAYDNRTQTPNSPLPQIAITDFGTLGGNANGAYIYEATRYEILDNLSWTSGIHTFRFGVDMNWNPQRQSRETNPGGLYTFNTFADYLSGKIARYQQALPANGTQGLYTGTQQDHGIYAMDTIKLRRDITITAGLRWDGQIEPQPNHPNPKYPITSQVPNDLKMWQPRLGIAYDVAGKGKTVVRLSAGLYDARTPAYLIQRAFTDNGIDVLVLDTNTDPSILKLLTPPNGLSSIPAGVKTPINAIYAMDPNYKNPRSFQGALTLEQQIGRATKLTVGFTRNSTWGLQRRYDRNLFAPQILSNGLPVYPAFDSTGNLVQASGFNSVTGLPVFTDSTGKILKAAVARPDPTIGQLNVNESSAHSDYNGLSINVTHRFSHRLQVLFNYTYSTTHDDDSNERDFNRQQALDTYNLKLDAAYSRTDIRHNGNISGLYDLPWGFTLSTILFAHSGLPYRAVTGFDTQNDGNTVNDVPIYNGQIVRRFTFRQPGFFDWDMRLLKQFKLGERMRLSFSIEGFNLTRASNKGFGSSAESTYGVQLPNGATNPLTGLPFTSNTAGVPSAIPGTDRFGGARQGQIGARFVF